MDFNTAFAVWAGVVGMVGLAIVWELSRLRNELKDISHQLNSYIVSMERRVTHIETQLSMSSRIDFRRLEEPQ